MNKIALNNASKRLIGTYRKSAEKAAGANEIISKTEQKNLSTWSQQTVQKLRDKRGGTITVDQFADSMGGKIWRALRSVSKDGKTLTQSNVQKLKVTELRTSASKLFEVKDNAGAPGSVAFLRAAVKAAQEHPELESYGRSFSFDASFKGDVPDVLADALGLGDGEETEGVEELFSIVKGQKAIAAFTKDLDDEADFEEDDATPSSENECFRNIAAGIEGGFKLSKFEEVLYACHTRTEDGDFDYYVLMGKKREGEWQVLTYVNNPY